MIHVFEVSQVYGEEQIALDHITYAFEAGSTTLITGHSGAGKTTLLNIISGQIKPTHGRVTLDGQRLDNLQERERCQLRQQMGVVTQRPQWLEGLSVRHNVELPLRLQGYSSEQALPRVLAALSKVGLPHVATRLPNQLSAGEQQRLNVARAIVHAPRCLFADEPTANLDANTAKSIHQLFAALSAANVTVVVATHDPEGWCLLPHRTLTLQKGQLQEPC